MKKGLEVSAWVIGLVIVLLAAAVLIVFMSGMIGNANRGASQLSYTATNVWNDPCSQAKIYVASNPNKACNILCNNNLCRGQTCMCGDLCIKCDCSSGKYIGTC